jgi:hypothetical protein
MTTYRFSILLLSVFALVTADRIALGQGGSTGGTLGKTDKAASGGQESLRQSQSKGIRTNDSTIPPGCQYDDPPAGTVACGNRVSISRSVNCNCGPAIIIGGCNMGGGTGGPRKVECIKR